MSWRQVTATSLAIITFLPVGKSAVEGGAKLDLIGWEDALHQTSLPFLVFRSLRTEEWKRAEFKQEAGLIEDRIVRGSTTTPVVA